jgi:hypothetical protein
MHLKPPVTSARLKCLAVVGALTLGIGGAVLTAVSPASADPSFQFVAVGSDTTQNVMDYFAGQTGDGILASYDAENPVTLGINETITPAIAEAGGAQQDCSFSRPNGSTQGFKALDFSYNPSTTLSTGLPSNPQAGCIAISRSSSGPGAIATSGPGAALTTGNLVYIPFAIDAVTYATGPVSATSETVQCVSTTTGCTNVGTDGNPAGIGTITFTTTPTTISQTADFSQSQLETLYADCSSVTVGSTTYDPVGVSYAVSAISSPASPAVFTTSTSNSLTAGQVVTLSGTLPTPFTAGNSYYVVSPTSTTFELAATSGGTAIASTGAAGTYTGTVDTPGNIDLYVPQNGSGTLSFWESTMGVSAVQTCWHQTVLSGPAAGIQVEEHDGTALASDPNGIAPISIAKWLGMNNGAITPDVRHGDVLQTVTVGTTLVPPTSGGDMNVAGCLSGTAFSQATCFPFNREIYNVVDYYQVVNTAPLSGTTGNPAFSPVLSGLFAGSGSSLCGSTFTIENLGFAPIPSNTEFPYLCGSTGPAQRVQMNNTSAEG